MNNPLSGFFSIVTQAFFKKDVSPRGKRVERGQRVHKGLTNG